MDEAEILCDKIAILHRLVTKATRLLERQKHPKDRTKTYKSDTGGA